MAVTLTAASSWSAVKDLATLARTRYGYTLALLTLSILLYIIYTWDVVHTPPTSIGPAHNQLPEEIFKFVCTRDAEFSLGANLRGRLGNNLFGYATMIGLAKRQNRIPVLVPNEEIMRQNGKEFLYGFNLYHARRCNTITKWLRVKETAYGRLNDHLLHLPETDVMLHGYLQSWKYFHQATPELLEDLTFSDEVKAEVDSVLTPLYSRYPGHTPVGVHVRRGDFLKSKYSRLGYTTAPLSYFQKAFDYMRQVFSSKHLVFLVVSDDMDWCKQNLPSTGHQIFFPPPATPVTHLAIMARANHTIISGGSYGWWGAWLAGGWSRGGVTVYYNGFPQPGSHLEEGLSREDYYLPHWVPLE